MIYLIENDVLSVQIDENGAELVSIKLKGEERLWQNENGSWDGHSPVIFPVCGNCKIVVDGKAYPDSLHGFAKGCKFTMVEKGDTFVKMRLQSNEDTLALYPYAFCLTYTYSVNENCLEIEHEVYNPSNQPIYFSMGGHESFQLKEDVDAYEIRFEKTEKLLHRFHTVDEGWLTGETLYFGEAKVLGLPKEILQEGKTVILSGIKSNQVSLYKKTGEKLAELSFEGFDNLLLWRPEGAKMICIEPWKNLPDGIGGDNTELSQKKGMETLAAKATFTTKRVIKYY